VIKLARTYEIIDPRSIGLPASSLVLGKLSGRHAFKERLQSGLYAGRNGLSAGLYRFIALADKKREVTDKDIESLLPKKSA